MARAISHPDKSSALTRRDFLYIATASVGAVGVAASLVPLIDQMNPDAGTLAAGGPVDLDLSKVAPGQQVVVRWRSRPIFVINRPTKVLDALKSQTLQDRLADPQSQQHQQPPYAQNWHRSVKPEYGVLVGICTHLGCIPMFYPQSNPSQPAADWPGGYFCPCHGSNTTSPAVFSAAFRRLTTCRYRPIVSSATRKFALVKIRPVRGSILPPSARFRWLLPSCRGGINSPLVGQCIDISLGMNDQI